MRRSQPLITGRLVAHGVAPYQFRDGADHSYYLKLATTQGEQVLWGTDLKRAIEKAVTQPKIGDLLGARRIARERVMLAARPQDPRSGSAGERERPAYRNRWVVERVQFFAERALLARRVREDHMDLKQAIRRQPELVSTFLSLRGAKLLAERRIADPQDRERFLALLKEAMASSVERGDPLPAVRMRDRAKPREARTPGSTMKRQDPAR